MHFIPHVLAHMSCIFNVGKLQTKRMSLCVCWHDNEEGSPVALQASSVSSKSNMQCVSSSLSYALRCNNLKSFGPVTGGPALVRGVRGRNGTLR